MWECVLLFVCCVTSLQRFNTNISICIFVYISVDGKYVEFYFSLFATCKFVALRQWNEENAFQQLQFAEHQFSYDNRNTFFSTHMPSYKPNKLQIHIATHSIEHGLKIASKCMTTASPTDAVKRVKPLSRIFL